MASLRPYQVEAFDQITATTADFLVDHPTGSGKTYLMTAIAAHLVTGNRRILITTTQGHIQDSFTNRRYDHLVVGGCTVPIPPSLLQRAGEDGATITHIESYLASRPDFVLVCTHAALTRIRPPTDVDVVAGDVLIVDEAHHASAIGLSQFITAWRVGGGRVLFFTATPSRGDEKPVRLPEMQLISRPLFQHMQEGYAPSVISHSITAVKTDGAVSFRVFTGLEQPTQDLHESLLQHITAAWIEAGRPKLIVRVPAVRGGASELVQRTLATFTNLGARTLDVTGTAIEDRQRIEDALRQERDVNRFEDSSYDVLVGVNRVYEALDWKWCSAFFSIGFPAAYSTAMQMLGRTTRLKPADYPVAHRDVAMIRFFVPVNGDASLGQASRYHAQRVLLACVQMADAQVGYTFTTISRLHKYMQASLSHCSVSAAELTDAYPYIDPAVRAELYRYIAAAVEAHVAASLVPTNASIYLWVTQHHPKACGPVLQQLLIESSVGSRQETAQAVAKAVALHHMGGLPLRSAIIRAYESIEPDFLRETVTSSAIYTNFAMQTLQLTGEKIHRFAVELVTVRPLTRAWVIDRLLVTLSGIQPEIVDTDIVMGIVLGMPVPDWPSESWRHIERSINNGERQWVGPEQSLRELVRAARSHTIDMLIHGFYRRQPLGPCDTMLLARFSSLETDGVCIGDSMLGPASPSLTPFFREWFSLLIDSGQPLQSWLAAYSFVLFSHLADYAERSTDIAGIADLHNQMTTGVWLRFEVPAAVRIPAPRYGHLLTGGRPHDSMSQVSLHIPADNGYCGPAVSHFLRADQRPNGSILLSDYVDQSLTTLNDNVDLVQGSYVCVDVTSRVNNDNELVPYKKGIQGHTSLAYHNRLVVPFSWVNGVRVIGQAGYRNVPLSATSMCRLLGKVMESRECPLPVG